MKKYRIVLFNILSGISLFFVTVPATSETLQNVVVIVADDHALHTTGAYGNDLIRTPNIDQLTKEGITFTRAYCNSPICSASRQSLLTGKYPHATGVNLLFTPFPDEGNTTIAEHLKYFNYQTAIIGKTHWNNWLWYSLYENGLPDHGFDTIVSLEDYKNFLSKQDPEPLPKAIAYYNQKEIDPQNVGEWMNCWKLPHPIRDADSSGTFFAKEAIRFIKQNRETPFFLWLAFKEPHHPYYFPVEYAEKYDPADMPLPEGSPEDNRWVPEKFRNLSDTEKRGIIASYYTSTEYMDKNVGLVTDAIKREGLEDSTLVIYISDNGYLLNEHKRFEKHTMWEEAVHQPLIIKLGDNVEKGIRKDAMVEYVDIVPTILELIEKPAIQEAQGASFKDVLHGKKQTHRTHVFSEYLQDNLAMISDGKWKYVFHTGSRDLGIGYQTGYGPSGIFHRLYDIEADPIESRNLAYKEEFQNKVEGFQNILLQRFQDTHPEANQCPKELSLVGKLVWFCEPRDIGETQNLTPAPTRVFEYEG